MPSMRTFSNEPTTKPVLVVILIPVMQLKVLVSFTKTLLSVADTVTVNAKTGPAQKAEDLATLDVKRLAGQEPNAVSARLEEGGAH